jgi:predicted acyl esterase
MSTTSLDFRARDATQIQSSIATRSEVREGMRIDWDAAIPMGDGAFLVVFQGAQDPHTPVGQGWRRASRRKLDPALTLPYRPYHTHDKPWPLVPGTPVELDIEIWPTCIVVPASYRIALAVRGKNYVYEGGPAELPGVRHSLTGVGSFLHTDRHDRPPSTFRNQHSAFFQAAAAVPAAARHSSEIAAACTIR